MKKYLVTISVMEGKIPMIRIIRDLTDASLRDAKEFVEEKFQVLDGYISRKVEFIVTESQLGKFLIKGHIRDTNSSAYSIVNIKELEQSVIVDLSEFTHKY